MTYTIKFTAAVLVAGIVPASVLSAEPATNAFAAGIEEIERGDYDQAIVCFEMAVDEDADSACAYNNLGYCQMKAGRFEEAEASLSKAIDITCEHVDRAYFNRTKLYVLQERYQEALKDADVAIGLMKTEIPYRYFVRGKIFYQLNQFQPAISDFSEAAALDPEMEDAALIYRARSLWKLKAYKRACLDLLSIHQHAGTLRFPGFPVYFIGAWILFPSLIIMKLRFSAKWVDMTQKQCDFMQKIRLMNRKQADRCVRFEAGRFSAYLYTAIGLVLMGISVPLFLLPLFI